MENKMISIIADNQTIPVKWVEFSDGALTCLVDKSILKAKKYITLFVNPTTPCKQIIEEISLIKDALSEIRLNWNSLDTNLYIPYLPYARADRVFEKGNPLPLEIFLSKLSSFMFDSITTCDVHNEEFLQNYFLNSSSTSHFNLQPQLKCLTTTIPKEIKFNCVVAPDKGAVKKASTVANYYNSLLIFADKIRDVSTGKIKSIDINVDSVIPTSNVLICDDICDGGGTFIPIAKKLKEKGCGISLYVTHMIGSKGLDIFKDSIDSIYYYHIVGNYINPSHILEFNNRIQ
jgi:ribose-phosphate pyrophosphokinase